ncbi:MAG: FAD:protein FMN transferase [Candidatus Limnocylindrales bacterium]
MGSAHPRATKTRHGSIREPIAPISETTSAMGGRLAVHIASTDAVRAGRDAQRVLARMCHWGDRLSRHLDTSELSRLNAAPGSEVLVGPTLAAALAAGASAQRLGDGLVDVTLLDERLAAEGLLAARSHGPASGRWSVTPDLRRGAVVQRPAGLRFDLGGIAKGWLADRALALLTSWPSVVIDADGDLAIRGASGQRWEVAVDDPRAAEATLAILHLDAQDDGWPSRWGVATSGTSVHRWHRDGRVRHHLIDPRTRQPAVTDIIQATVICATALQAEAFAKATVIAGSHDGLTRLERAGVDGAVILTERHETLALPGTLALLAA